MFVYLHQQNPPRFPMNSEPGRVFFLYAQCNGIYQELGTRTLMEYKFIVYSLELIVYSSF